MIFNWIDKDKSDKRLLALVGVIFILACIPAIYLLRNTRPLVDEAEHYAQIIGFIHGEYHLLEISTLPGYHVIMAMLAGLTGLTSLQAMRLITLLCSLGTVPVFYLLARKLSAGDAITKTCQYFFLPVLFVFFFLVYTDAMSLFFILLMFWFNLNGRHAFSGMAAIAAMMIRQNNIVWLGFAALMFIMESGAGGLSVRRLIGKGWTYLAGILLFVLFLIWNGGVAVGDVSHHPAFRLSAGNVVVSLFYFFVLFLPLHIANLRKVVALLKKGAGWLVIPAFIAYWFFFSADHPYNSLAPHYFLRNRLLMAISASALYKAVFFIPVFYAVLSLAVTRLRRRRFYLLYLFWVAALAPSWLIEQRYFLVPFVLFILFKEEPRKQLEYATVMYYILILAVLFPPIAGGRLFL